MVEMLSEVDRLWAEYQRLRRAWDVDRDPGAIDAVVAAYHDWAMVFAPAHAGEFVVLLARILHREADIVEYRWRPAERERARA